MFRGKMKDAIEKYNLLEILYYIKHDTGIDFRLDLHDKKDRIIVYFTLDYIKYTMKLDYFIFDKNLELTDKYDCIMNELIDVFNLPDSPIDNFKNAIAKEFKVYEKLDDERIDVKVIPFDDNYNVTVILTNNNTGEKREFNKCFICDMNNDITYINAGELGYKFAHNMLSEIDS